ncbi:DDE-domain-containing protein, partial [Athelia psychrophila]
HRIATSENGWTSDFIGAEWFKTIFIPNAKARNTSGQPILLIYDGHGSHTANEMREIALQEGIHLFCLPPHTSHKLQPLDVGVFGPTQNAWQRRCEDVLAATGEGIQLRDVVKEYMLARNEAFKPETILQAWRRSGIRPIDPGFFTDIDYAPSHYTSTIAHLPASFP